MLRHSPAAPLAPSVLFGLDSKLFSRKDEEVKEFARMGWSEGHGDEVESWGVWRGRGERVEDLVEKSHDGHAHAEGEECTVEAAEQGEVDTTEKPRLDWDEVIQPFLATLPSSIYRVKGLLRLPPPPSVLTTSSASITPYSAQPLPTPPASSSSTPPPAPSAAAVPTPTPSAMEVDTTSERLYILNWAFGRYTLTELPQELRDEERFEGVEVRLTMMGERGEVKRWVERLKGVVGGLVR